MRCGKRCGSGSTGCLPGVDGSDLMRTEIKPRVSQVRCYKCGSPGIVSLCHHCWRPGCAKHVKPTPRWVARLLGPEGAGRDLGTDASYHCHECGHAAAGYQLALGAGGLGVMIAGLILILLNPVVGLAMAAAGVLLAGWAYLTARRRAARRRAGLPLALQPKINDVRLTERLGVDITLAPEGGYRTRLRPVEGDISVALVFGPPDRERLDRYAGKRASGRDTRFCAGCLVLHGPVDIAPQPDLPGPIRQLEGTTTAYPVFRAEDPHASSPFPLTLTYRLAREPALEEGPVWVTPSLVPESARRALELDIQWVELGPRDKRLSLDVIDLIQLRYPEGWGKVEKASYRGIQFGAAEDCGGPESLRQVEWRQLLPTGQQRHARQLKLMIRFEGEISSDDQVSGRLEATMKGALSGLDGVRLYSSLGKRRDDWRGAAIRTRIKADFKLSLSSIRYQDVLIVPERQARENEDNADPFAVIPDDDMVIALTNALSKDYYVKRVIEHPPRSGGMADHVQRYWDIAGRRYEGVYPIDFHMVLTGEEIHRGGVRPVAGTTKIAIVVQGAYTNDDMKDRIKGEWDALDYLTRETMLALASRRPGADGSDPPSGTMHNSSSGAAHNGSSGPAHSGTSGVGADPSHRRLLERLGKLDEALVDGRISREQYEEMKVRAEQEFGGWEA
jgi:hypothetical protein